MNDRGWPLSKIALPPKLPKIARMPDPVRDMVFGNYFVHYSVNVAVTFIHRMA